VALVATHSLSLKAALDDTAQQLPQSDWLLCGGKGVGEKGKNRRDFVRRLWGGKGVEEKGKRSV